MQWRVVAFAGKGTKSSPWVEVGVCFVRADTQEKALQIARQVIYTRQKRFRLSAYLYNPLKDPAMRGYVQPV